MKNYMHINTGTVDTAENWLAEYISMPMHEWHGYEDEEDFEANFPHDDKVACWDFCLVEVQKNDKGEWEQV